MASSGASQETGSSNQKAQVYEIRGRTMSFEEWELVVQVESEGEKTTRRGGLNCVLKKFLFLTLKNCSQVQSLK